jgi:hypothetical protein
MSGRHYRAITVEQLARVIRHLPQRAAFTGSVYAGSNRQPKPEWLAWLREYEEAGYYRRRNPTHLASRAYNHLKNPAWLLWLCEQLGVPKSQLRRAAQSAQTQSSKAAQAGAFRRVVPWSYIESLLRCRLLKSADGQVGDHRRIRTPRELRQVIESLSPASPLTDRFRSQWRALAHVDKGAQERANVWYRTQHEHWLGWLAGWNGPGAYNRKDWRRSAQFVYDHVVNPQMLVYLAEAAGLPKAVVSEAISRALAHRTSMSSMSAAVRRVIPWQTVEIALLERRGAR